MQTCLQLTILANVNYKLMSVVGVGGVELEAAGDGVDGVEVVAAADEITLKLL